MRTARKPSVVYDRGHRYAIAHDRDPAWPGMTPEPARKATVAGVRNVPAARSWVACAERVHHDLVAEMAHAFPGRRVTRIVGWGDQTDAWMACNDGPDGNGAWWIPYDAQTAAGDLETARHERGGGPRGWQHSVGQSARLLVAVAALALTAWMTVELLGAARAPEQTRVLIGLMAAAAAVVFLAAAAVFVRRRNPDRR